MTAETTDSSFILADPRRMDGTPYQVAERAIRQVAAAAIRLSEALDAADVMARNAELERTTALDPEADLKPVAMNWPTGPQGRLLREADAALVTAANKLELAAAAASWDPKARVPADG